MYLFYDILSRFISVGFFIFLGSVLILNFLTHTPEYINILIIMNISFVYRYITVHVISKLTNWIANDDTIKYKDIQVMVLTFPMGMVSYNQMMYANSTFLRDEKLMSTFIFYLGFNVFII